MKHAVFDTNVLVSGFLSPAGPPGRIVEWLRSGEVVAVVDDRIWCEYHEVLQRPAFRLPTAEVRIVLESIRARSLWVEPLAKDLVAGLPDPDDAPFLECARAARVPLVSGNLRHFPRAVTGTVRVLSPAQFVTSLAGLA